jgi:hypothetical protein
MSNFIPSFCSGAPAIERLRLASNATNACSDLARMPRGAAMSDSTWHPRVTRHTGGERKPVVSAWIAMRANPQQTSAADAFSLSHPRATSAATVSAGTRALTNTVPAF